MASKLELLCREGAEADSWRSNHRPEGGIPEDAVSTNARNSKRKGRSNDLGFTSERKFQIPEVPSDSRIRLVQVQSESQSGRREAGFRRCKACLTFLSDHNEGN